MAPLPTNLREQGIDVAYITIALLCQTFLFGVYAVLTPLSAYFVMKRNKRTRKHWLLWVSIFMFSLSTAYWAGRVAHLFLRFRFYFIQPSRDSAMKVDIYATIPNAVILINYVLTDGIVVWRAWILCCNDSKRLLYIPCAFLSLSSLSVVSTIAIRVAITVYRITHAGVQSPGLTRAIDIAQVGGLIFGLITNISSTGIISAKAWKHRRTVKRNIRDAQRNGTKVETVFALVIESGAIYCASNITLLIATVVHIPRGTLGDVYTPINVQFAGIYPIIVLLVVNLQLTMKETAVLSGSGDGEIESLEFSSLPDRAHSRTALRGIDSSAGKVEDDQRVWDGPGVPRSHTLVSARAPTEKMLPQIPQE